MDQLHSTEHEMIRQHLAVLQNVITVLNYPDDLTHKVRRGWAQIQLTLRGICHYFSVVLPEHFKREEREFFDRLTDDGKLSADEIAFLEDLKTEHEGLRLLTGSIIDIIRPWLNSNEIPTPFDAQLLSALKFELDLHIEQHEQIEEKILIPLAQRLLTESALEQLLLSMGYEIEPPDKPVPFKRSA